MTAVIADKHSAAMLNAFAFARKLEDVSPTLATWARDLARCGWTEDEIKAKLHEAMQTAAR